MEKGHLKEQMHTERTGDVMYNMFELVARHSSSNSSSSKEGLQNLVNRAHVASNQAGLYPKTKVMKIIRNLVINEQEIISFKFLSSKHITRYVTMI